MNILSVIHYPVFGGPHNRNRRLYLALKDKGFNTTVLLPEDPGNAYQILNDAGIKTIKIPLHRIRATLDYKIHFRFIKNFISDIYHIKKAIIDHKIDLVQINGLVNTQAIFAAKLTSTPVVWQILDTHTPKFLRYVLYPLIKTCPDALMSTGKKVAKEHPGLINNKKIVYFYPPVDTKLFKTNIEKRKEIRKIFGCNKRTVLVGTLGNVNNQKGHDTFIKAAAILFKKEINTKFVILGSVHINHQKYIDSLWDLAKELGLTKDENIFQVDPTANAHELLNALDIFWMTPKPNSEGIPTALEEAMSTSLPVISFNVGSIAELISNDVSGYIVEDQDYQKIASLTLDLLEKPEKIESLGKAGRDFILAEASIQKCADSHIMAYQLAVRNFNR